MYSTEKLLVDKIYNSIYAYSYSYVTSIICTEELNLETGNLDSCFNIRLLNCCIPYIFQETNSC